MKQALHIFRKDVRYLRFEIGMSLLAAAALCFAGTRHAVSLNETTPNQGLAFDLLVIFLPLTWWFLIARLIHAEALCGDRQFWVTRPYHWKSLLAAKALFAVAFIHIPLFLADLVMLRAAGFSVSEQMMGLLWTQVLLAVAFVLPVAAISAIVNGLVPFIVAIFVLLGGILMLLLALPILRWQPHGLEVAWIQVYLGLILVAAGALAILLWQYTQRRTIATRTLAGVTAVVALAVAVFFPWTAAFAIQTHLSAEKIDASSIQLGIDWNRKWLARIRPGSNHQVAMELPLQVSGTPEMVRLNGITITFVAPGGETWRVDQPPSTSIGFDDGIISLEAGMDADFYKKVRKQPLRLRGRFYFTLYGNPQSTSLPVPARAAPVKNIGRCATTGGPNARQSFMICNSAFRMPPGFIDVRFQGPGSLKEERARFLRRGLVSYSPFPADLSLDPVNQIFAERQSGSSRVIIHTSEALAYLEKDFEINDIRLSDFESSSSSGIQ